MNYEDKIKISISQEKINLSLENIFTGEKLMLHMSSVFDTNVKIKEKLKGEKIKFLKYMDFSCKPFSFPNYLNKRPLFKPIIESSCFKCEEMKENEKKYRYFDDFIIEQQYRKQDNNKDNNEKNLCIASECDAKNLTADIKTLHCKCNSSDKVASLSFNDYLNNTESYNLNNNLEQNSDVINNIKSYNRNNNNDLPFNDRINSSTFYNQHYINNNTINLPFNDHISNTVSYNHINKIDLHSDNETLYNNSLYNNIDSINNNLIDNITLYSKGYKKDEEVFDKENFYNNSNIPLFKNFESERIFSLQKNFAINNSVINYNLNTRNLEKNKSNLNNNLFECSPKGKLNNAFHIVPENITGKKDLRTTCMIKNIPNKYTQDMLINLLNENHYGNFDFVYLRMDFENNCNVGYAFVNFIETKYVLSFYYKIHGKGWKGFSSSKIAELTYASIQGLENLKKKFKKSTILFQKESYRPKVFYTYGRFIGHENKDFFK